MRGKWKRNFLVALFIAVLPAALVDAQGVRGKAMSGQPPVFAQRPEIPAGLSFFAPFFLPKVLQDNYRLKQYVLGDEFAEFRHEYGDVYAIDALFDMAMRLSWNNVYEALLISFVATMDHNKFGVRLPFVGALLWAPLTSEFSEEFSERLRALPSRLYPDSPPEGDRDKLQHFFGSALITFLTESREASERVGYFVEWGEDRFIVGGTMDDRDMRANRQGQQYGLRLLQDSSARPSEFFRFALAADPLGFFLEER